LVELVEYGSRLRFIERLEVIFEVGGIFVVFADRNLSDERIPSIVVVSAGWW
jgi:hypothetical protein